MRRPGTPKTGGRSKGTPNRGTILRIAEFVASNDIEIASKIWSTIEAIEEPADKAKALLQFYKFIEPEAKESLTNEDVEAEPPTDVLSIIKGATNAIS